MPGASQASRSGGNREPRLTWILASGPVRGPFVPDCCGVPPPGRVEYLGAGTVRLDEAATSSLAELDAGADFRVIFADSVPVLLAGTIQRGGCPSTSGR